MLTEEDSNKLISKIKIYNGSRVIDVMNDIEAGLGAIVAFFINRDSKRMNEIRDNVLIKMKQTDSNGIMEMLMEASITMTVMGMKLKDEMKEEQL